MPSDNQAIIRRLYEEVWNGRKLASLDELLSPSHALHGPNFSGSSIGPEAYKLQVAQFVRAFPDLRWEIEETISENDKVVVVWTFTGTHKGEYRGVAATKKKVGVDGITVHHITDGKIMDSYANWDTWGMMKQLGVVPALGKPQNAAAR
ncbi:MAG TPA: ester cyclase [Methylomirabilota bacterium]|nr:ester cyclase [Methylomirabilota bacterium]